MAIKNNFRYDPLYRIIDETQEMRIIEGHLKEKFKRLKKINSLGVIPEVIEMAKYAKYEHAYGTIHQINCLISIDGIIEKKHQLPLKISAQFLHLGHLPFTYSTERALILALNIGKKKHTELWKKEIEGKIEAISKLLGKSEDQKKELIEEIFLLKYIKIFHRIFSVDVLLSSWNKLEKKFDCDDTTLKEIVGNIIDYQSPGYNYLAVADKTDFVQRDALYFGTVKLDISPRHLYQNLSKNILQVSQEEMLIDNNFFYLKNVFYKNEQITLFTRLYEKIVASLFISDQFQLKWALDYDDDSFKWLICQNKDKDNKKCHLPQEWIIRANDLFEKKFKFKLIFSLNDFYCPKTKTILDLESELMGIIDDNSKLFSYPFERSVLVSIDYDNEASQYIDNELYSDGYEWDTMSINVYQDEKNKDLTELLKILQNLSQNLSYSDAEYVQSGLGNLLSWTSQSEMRPHSITKRLAEIFEIIDNESPTEELFLIRLIKSLSSIDSFKMLWDNPDQTFLMDLITNSLKNYITKNPEKKLESYQRSIIDLLKLPIKNFQQESIYPFLDEIIKKIVEKIKITHAKNTRGEYFEALCVIEKIRNPQGNFQILLPNYVIIDSENNPKEQNVNEFDIIELRLNRDNQAELWIYACSISKRIKQNNQESIAHLVDSIHDAFPDLIIKSRYISPENLARNKWLPSEKPTGRGYP